MGGAADLQKALEGHGWAVQPLRIVPTLCVGMPLVTLCVTLWDAERPGLHSHAERGNDQRCQVRTVW
ncbi:hypothetical protein DJ480_25885 [Pseudomonas sp. Leaf98]|nr:hypothetical protein DJ480_25885 [Pseudomonas sp. Leaf98]